MNLAYAEEDKYPALMMVQVCVLTTTLAPMSQPSQMPSDHVQLLFAQVGFLGIRIHGYDPMRAGHLEFYLEIVWNVHELRVARLLEQCMVSAREGYHLEGE